MKFWSQGFCGRSTIIAKVIEPIKMRRINNIELYHENKFISFEPKMIGRRTQTEQDDNS